MASIPSSFQSLPKTRPGPIFFASAWMSLFSDEYEEHLLREAGKRTSQCFYLAFGLHLIHASHGGDDVLDGLLVLPAVLDDLEVLIRTCLLYSGKHGRLLYDTHNLPGMPHHSQGKCAYLLAPRYWLISTCRQEPS